MCYRGSSESRTAFPLNFWNEYQESDKAVVFYYDVFLTLILSYSQNTSTMKIIEITSSLPFTLGERYTEIIFTSFTWQGRLLTLMALDHKPKHEPTHTISSSWSFLSKFQHAHPLRRGSSRSFHLRRRKSVHSLLLQLTDRSVSPFLSPTVYLSTPLVAAASSPHSSRLPQRQLSSLTARAATNLLHQIE